MSLSAIADSGYRFYKWVGDVDGDPYENPKTFVMTQTRYVEPLFVEEKVATPVISIPNGTATNQAGDVIFVERQEIVFKPVWMAKTLDVPMIEIVDEYDDLTTTVSLSHPSADEIRYTLDGSDPCAQSALYSAPFDEDVAST